MKKFIIVVILLLATVPAYVFINVLLERSRMSYEDVFGQIFSIHSFLCFLKLYCQVFLSFFR